MKLFKKCKEMLEPATMTLQKVKPTFITTDGVKHTGNTYKWANSSNLLCTVGEYAMIKITSNGYIKDEDGVMYPIPNVVSIKWDIVDEKVVKEFYSHYIYLSDDEVNKMPVIG